MNIRPATAADGPRISELLTTSWGSHIAVAHGVAYDATTLPAIVAEEDDRIVGLLTYNLQDQEFEVVTIPLTGAYGIPLRDELVLELRLTD